jgi:SAM-dependent methyltransferase
VVDLGCGDGRQTRFLGQHFASVVGTDISPSAVERARAADNPSTVRYRVLDARHPDEAQHLHAQLGDANVYVRGVLQALPPADRPRAIDSIARLVGETGVVFAKELPPEAASYFAMVAERYGLAPTLARVMQLIPPGQISLHDLVGLFAAHGFDVVATGTSSIHTVNTLPNGEVIRVPAIYALARRRTQQEVSP